MLGRVLSLQLVKKRLGRYRLRKRQLLEVHAQRPVRRCLLT
ncbi:hypothetical protein GBAR_LOCUS29056 [Geodia barretti]|uniref:Uncharacterized protein n=1 Tax=Geodia barretti TaxID=519541 RepID=A0AA35TST9_GEOBA|nr:hypothetical protein GBAR_LOCUS29056 [Geodia barretti]